MTSSLLPPNVKNGNELKDSNILHESDDKNIKFPTRSRDLISSGGTSGVLIFGFFFLVWEFIVVRHSMCSHGDALILILSTSL